MIRFMAYIDPASGSLILQAAIGTIMGVSFAARNQIRDIIAKFRKDPQASKPEND